MIRRVDVRLTLTEAEFLLSELRPDRKMSSVLIKRLKSLLEKAPKDTGGTESKP